MAVRMLSSWYARIGLGLLFLLVILAFVFGPSAARVWRVITLYDEDKIVNNFLGMNTLFPIRIVTPSPEPLKFKEALAPLPQTFNFKGKAIKLDDFFQANRTTGLLVLHNDTIKAEQYFLGNTNLTPHIAWSVSKSFVSALVGIAVKEGHILGIEEAVTDYVPELKNSGYDGVSIKDVLQMSSGVRFNEDYADFNSDINRFGRTIAFGQALDDYVASLTREREPGTFHHYVSIDTQVLGMVISRATRTPFADYFQEKLWHPMGAESEGYWIIDDVGTELALGGLNATARDFAKLGLLYANRGQLRGEQIIPEDWAYRSVTPDAAHLMPGENPASSSRLGYGFQWWIPEEAEDEFLAMGIYNQYIYVDPDEQIVVVMNSANHRYLDGESQWTSKSIALFRDLVKHYAVE